MDDHNRKFIADEKQRAGKTIGRVLRVLTAENMSDAIAEFESEDRADYGTNQLPQPFDPMSEARKIQAAHAVNEVQISPGVSLQKVCEVCRGKLTVLDAQTLQRRPCHACSICDACEGDGFAYAGLTKVVCPKCKGAKGSG